MWRIDDQVGVQFLKDTKTMRPAMRAPVTGAVDPAATSQDADASSEQPADGVDIDTLPQR